MINNNTYYKKSKLKTVKNQQIETEEQKNRCLWRKDYRNIKNSVKVSK